MRPLLALYRKIMPGMSDTEREALEAGTVWWEAELFSGRPDWHRLLGFPAPALTAEEQAFLDWLDFRARAPLGQIETQSPQSVHPSGSISMISSPVLSACWGQVSTHLAQAGRRRPKNWQIEEL